MKPNIKRRQVIAGLLMTPWLRWLNADAYANTPSAALHFGPTQPFSSAWLRDYAKQLAARPYQAPTACCQDVLWRIDFDAYQQIRYRPEYSLWSQGDGPYPARLFHMGKFFRDPVKIHLVRDGVAREVLYSPGLFEFGKAHFAETLPADLGFAGFRLMEHGDDPSDWISFLGKSYFRSAGDLDQYGLSTRGIAIDTALTGRDEEFPSFTHFWLEPGPDPKVVVIHALLNGPSITGAYRIEALKDGQVFMAVEANLFARTAIQRMGIAPLTSMFWFSEANRQRAQLDWRPEIHDSDGLVVWTGKGERLWRPLNNPTSVLTSSFLDDNPKGFGLLQRDRDFTNYEDDGVFYERRPNLWVKPLDSWGEGTVQLVEIPTDDEIHDNIVAYWVPKEPVLAGSAWHFRYRLYWSADEPYSPGVARVIATRMGRGGVTGQPRPPNKEKLVIDFAGGPLEHLEKSAPVELVVASTRGAIDNTSAIQVVGTKRWRAFFDIDLNAPEPADIRAYLRLGDQALTETWLYHYAPRPAA